MRPFSSVAVPHKDILEGKLTMDVFAADLWQVYKGTAPEEYQNPNVFFRKTYLTSGLSNLISIAKKRFEGRGGDAVIQLFTPFGGGKTHSLIALYHKAKEWKARTVVIDGVALDPRKTAVWEEIERQLTGKIEILKGKVAPGKDELGSLLAKHQPILILMDELLQYATRAAGVRVGNSYLVSQLYSFIQALTETVKALDKTLLVLTLPSSLLEQYDENAEEILARLQKIAGRIERVYTPVLEEEISEVIRRRLFSRVDQEEARKIVEEFLEYAEAERILPADTEKAIYREKFIKSYPFSPEVIEVLYKRWGSFPTFQRTRGVLRILALVVHSLLSSRNPFIRLSDFDLKNPDIRRELINHIGQEFDSIIAADITSEDSGAKRVDKSLGDAYRSYNFGTKAATAIFMYSFSGGQDKGATLNDIKLSASEIGTPSSIVSEAISKLKEQLFYLSDDGLYFTNRPNLNRIVLTKMEGIDDRVLVEEEEELLKSSVSANRFECYIWPSFSRDVRDNKNLKLVILRDCENIKEIFDMYGDRPRVYRNTLIFLCQQESERAGFYSFLKKKMAWQMIETDSKLNITEEQRRIIRENLRRTESEQKEKIRRLYRKIFLPSRDGFKEYDLGIPIVGAISSLDEEVYSFLKSQGELLYSLKPDVIAQKFLKDRNYVETKILLESFYKTPGELKITSDKVVKKAIQEGVRNKIFGLGVIEKETPVCKHFGDEVSPTIEENEVLISKEHCQPVNEGDDEIVEKFLERIRRATSKEELKTILNEVSGLDLSEEKKKMLEEEVNKKLEALKGPSEDVINRINLKLAVPSGKLSDIARIVRFLSERFDEVKVVVDLSVDKGELTVTDYEDKIKEALQQADIKVQEEEINK